MKKLFIWISDVHLSIKNLTVSIQVLRESLELARNRNVPLVISGDLNDGKAIMRSEWVSALINLFDEFVDVKIYVLTGNHDMDNKNSNTHSLEFLKPIRNVVIIDKPSVHYVSGHPFFCIPYCINTDAFKDALNQARANGITKVIAHQGVLGASIGDYLVDESSVSPEEFADFDIVLLGHYHKFQRNLNYIYCGSPFTTNFSEADQIKFIHEVDMDEPTGILLLAHHETNVRRHVKYLIESDEDLSKIKNIPCSLAQVVIKGDKAFIKKYSDITLMKQLSGAESISIIPEINRQSEHRISAEILHSPLKVINHYLDDAKTILDKEKLKDYLFNAAQDLLTSFSSNTSKSFNITRATAKNFLSFQELDFTYSAMGLTLVEGFDEDKMINTGAGKSSFFDVIVYGLFGQTSKDIKADEVINRIAKKDCEIAIYLSANDGDYILYRYRKHSKFDNDLLLVLPDGKELRGKDNRETQKLIEQELGCSCDLFLKSSYFTQFGAIDRFLSASDTEKKKLISDITDLSIYDNILEKVKSALRLNLDVLNGQEKELLKVQSSYDTTHHHLAQDKVNKDQWESSHNIKINNLKVSLNNWNNDRDAELFNARNQELEYEVQRQKNIDWALKLSQDFDIKIGQEVLVLEKELETFEQSKALAILAIEEKITQNHNHSLELKKQIDQLELQRGSEQLLADLSEVNKKLDMIEQLQAKAMKIEHSDIALIDSQIRTLQGKIKLEEEKLSVNANSTCQSCHQEISPFAIKNVIFDMNTDIQVLEKQRLPLVESLKDIRAMTEKKGITLAAKETIQDAIAKSRAVDDVIRSKSNEMTSLHNAHKNLVAQKEEKELQKSNAPYQITIVRQKVNPSSKEIETLKTALNPFTQQMVTLHNQINPFINSIKIEEETINPFINSVKEKESDLAIQQTKVDAAQSDVNKTSLDITYGEWWKQALHVYIKSYLMDSCLDQINDYTNEYLQTLFDGVLQFNITATTEAGKDTKEKIDISIINNGDECSYQSLSGGERCRICLAVNLALSQIISKTNGKNFGMIFLDEILNGLDEVGKAQSMKLLKELEERFQSVFIIDHAEGFQSLFTNSIMIKKRNKVSYIV
jgi:DNA repair exonuclease SbcCD ATPase subunit